MLCYILDWIHLRFVFFSSRRRHTRSLCDWSSDVCSSDLASPEILPETGRSQPTASRSRFELYRQKVRQSGLPHGSIHSSSDSRDARSRVRSAKQLVWQFFQLLAPFRRQVFWILA